MENDLRKISVVKLSVLSNSFLVASKLIIGVVIGSVSVISEAIHSAIDLVAALIAFFAVKNSNKPPDDEHRFGHGKIENISGFIEAVLIFIASLWIIFEAVKKLIYPSNIEEIGWGIAVMLISSALNFYVSRKLIKTAAETGSIAIKADGVHLMTDVYTSLGVALSLSLIWFMEFLFKGNHFHWLDPVCAIAVAILIIRAAWDLTMESFKDLMDSSISQEEISIISSAIEAMPLAMGYKSLKTRKSGNEKFVEMDLIFPPDISLSAAHEETDRLTALIKSKISNSHISIHMEPCLSPCPKACRPNCKNNSDKA